MLRAMNVQKTILLVDDDDDLRETLIEQFALHEEFKTVGAATAGDGRSGLPKPKSMMSSPARRPATFSVSMMVKT